MTRAEAESRMCEALALARQAAECGEVPIGALVVRASDGAVVGRGRNRVEETHDACAHAEIEALRDAMRERGDWRLEDCELVVTKEPCSMCAGALVNARIRKVWFGLPDPRSGACGSALDVTGFSGMLWNPEAEGGLLADECGETVRAFFRRVRKKGKAPDAPPETTAPADAADGPVSAPDRSAPIRLPGTD